MEEGFLDHPPNPAVLGTKTYLSIIWHYLNIFEDPTVTLSDRIYHSAVVVTFLGIWFKLNIYTNFITRETYQDVLLSCHFAVMIIVFMGDNFSHQECHLNLTRTDVVESFWSNNGQWVGNRHNYTFGDLQRNLSHMTRLEQISVDPNGPAFAKPHPKQESIWWHQTKDSPKANLTDYPSHNEVIRQWNRGVHEARRLATTVGMTPTNEDENETDSWFWKPFDEPGDI